MTRGSPSRAAAARLLHLLLPLCLLAATAVAVMGLFRVVRQPTSEPTADRPPSLRLGGPSASAAASPRPTPGATPKPQRIAAAAVVPARPERLTSAVEVVNASGIHGLATRTASALRSRGVLIAAIGNLSAAVRPNTRTVFYPPGERGQAQTLATLADAPTVAPAPGWLQPSGKLVLVVVAASPSVMP